VKSSTRRLLGIVGVIGAIGVIAAVLWWALADDGTRAEPSDVRDHATADDDVRPDGTGSGADAEIPGDDGEPPARTEDVVQTSDAASAPASRERTRPSRKDTAKHAPTGDVALRFPDRPTRGFWSTPGLAPETIDTTIQRQGRALVACVDAIPPSAARPELVMLEWRIAADGRVAAIDVRGAPSDMAECMRQVVERMRFPAPSSDEPVGVRYPLSFAGGE